MATVSGTLQGIADIEAPGSPTAQCLICDPNLWLTLVLILMLLLGCGYWLWHYYLSSRGQARRQLARLQHAVMQPEATTADTHTIAFQIARVLQQGLALRKVSQQTHLPAALFTHSQRWRRYNESLSRARYAPQQIDKNQLSELLRETDFWLRRWPGA